jgi:glycosyltransferase involved in cell wall biosynthesis
MKEISVLIPAYNEADSIRQNIEHLDAFLKENCSSYEIVVSEDGSTDGTDRILKELAGREIITHLHSSIRLGKGKAVRNAFFASSGERVFFTDADFPMEMEDIPKMLGLLGRYNMVIGSRSKGISAERSFARKMFSIYYNSFVRLLFRTGIKGPPMRGEGLQEGSCKGGVFTHIFRLPVGHGADSQGKAGRLLNIRAAHKMAGEEERKVKGLSLQG